MGEIDTWKKMEQSIYIYFFCIAQPLFFNLTGLTVSMEQPSFFNLTGLTVFIEQPSFFNLTGLKVSMEQPSFFNLTELWVSWTRAQIGTIIFYFFSKK